MARVAVLTPNPAIDVTYVVDDDTPGESHRVASISRRAGGKGLNVSAVIRTLGHSVVNILPVGGWSGDWLRGQLRTEGLPFIDVPIAGETRFTVATIRGVQHPTVFLEAGPTLTGDEQTQLVDQVEISMLVNDALIVSGSLPVGTPPVQVGNWVQIARQRGALSVVDTSGRALLAGAEARVDVLKPNIQEACAATGTQTAAAAAAALIDLGAGTVVISEGARGLTAYTRAETIRVSAVPNISGNPTGAGDAATAALTASLLDGKPLRVALRCAAAAGAAAVLSPLPGVIDTLAYSKFLSATPTKEEAQ